MPKKFSRKFWEDVETRVDHERGCGWRKKGGKYFIGGGAWEPCGLLPIPLHVCSACGQGVKFSRSPSWIDLQRIRGDVKQCANLPTECAKCSVNNYSRALLIWIGEKHYKTAQDFQREAVSMGISRRIQHIPHGFKIGTDVICLAHIRVINDFTPEHPEMKPGIFMVFKPHSIEYVCTGNETLEELEDLKAQGLTPVKVQRAAQERML